MASDEECDLHCGTPEQGMPPDCLMSYSVEPNMSATDAKIVNYPQTRARLYVEMNKIHQQMDEILQDERGVVVLCGLEGMGKTEESIQHVWRRRYEKAFYATANSKIDINTSFKQISVGMRMYPTDINPQTCVARVCEYLKGNANDHILILDDCKDPCLVEDMRWHLIDNTGHAAFRIIIISKSNWPENALSFPYKVIKIQGFDNDNIHEYLKNAKVPISDMKILDTYVKKLLTLSDGSPFVLNLMAKHIKMHNQSLDEYVDLREFEGNPPPIIYNVFSDAVLYSAPHVVMIFISMCSYSTGISIVEMFTAMAKMVKNNDDEEDDLKKYHHVDGFRETFVIAQNLQRKSAKPSAMRAKFKEILPSAWLPLFTFEGERVKLHNRIQESYQIWLTEHFHCDVCRIAIYLKFINIVFESEEWRDASNLENMYNRLHPLLKGSRTPTTKLESFQKLVLCLVDENMKLMQYESSISKLRYLESLYEASTTPENMNMIYSKLSEIYLWSGDSDEARKVARKALEHRTSSECQHESPHMILAGIERETGNFAEAFEAMEKAENYLSTAADATKYYVQMGKLWSSYYFQQVADKSDTTGIIKAASESIKYFKKAAKLSSCKQDRETNLMRATAMLFQRARFSNETPTIEPDDLNELIRNYNVDQIKTHAKSLYGLSNHEIGWFYSKIAWIKSTLSGLDKDGDLWLSSAAVRITFGVFGCNHVKTANAHKINGVVLRKRGREEAAVKQFERAKAIFVKLNHKGQRYRRLLAEM